MISISLTSARRVLSAAVACATVATLGVQTGSAQATVAVAGVPANQPTAPVKLQSCAAIVNGTAFTPQLVFDAPANLKSSTVTFSFFNASNVALGQTDLTPPYSPRTYPLATRSFTCAIAHEDLADGGVFPAAAAAHNNTGLIVAGVLAVGVIAALAGHGGSSSPTQTNTPTPVTFTPSPTPSPTATATLAPGVTPSPTPTATASLAPGATPSPTPTATPRATPTASLAPGATPSPTPTATARPTATPTATPSPTPTPSPVGALTVIPNSYSFTSTGATGTSTISDTNYTGAFTIQSNTCNSGGAADNGPIATFNPSPPTANNSTITVTSGEAGNCTITYQDPSGNIAQIHVQVTLSTVVVNGKHRAASSVAPSPKPQTAPAPRSGSGIVPPGTSASHKS